VYRLKLPEAIVDGCTVPHAGQGHRVERCPNCEPDRFKWAVHLNANRTRTGLSYSMKAAILDAQTMHTGLSRFLLQERIVSLKLVAVTSALRC
jgi:hypothetical protein